MFTKRIHTSERAKNILHDLKKKTGLLPNTLGRMAIIASLGAQEDGDEVGELPKDRKGLEFLPETLFGDQNTLLFALVKDSECSIDEHLEWGVNLLDRRYKLTGNREGFLVAAS